MIVCVFGFRRGRISQRSVAEMRRLAEVEVVVESEMSEVCVDFACHAEL